MYKTINIHSKFGNLIQFIPSKDGLELSLSIEYTTALDKKEVQLLINELVELHSKMREQE